MLCQRSLWCWVIQASSCVPARTGCGIAFSTEQTEIYQPLCISLISPCFLRKKKVMLMMFEVRTCFSLYGSDLLKLIHLPARFKEDLKFPRTFWFLLSVFETFDFVDVVINHFITTVYSVFPVNKYIHMPHTYTQYYHYYYWNILVWNWIEILVMESVQVKGFQSMLCVLLR